MEPREEIHILLQRIAERPKAIGLINTYKSLPIAYPAAVISHDGDSAIIRTEQLQVLCVSRDSFTYLQSEIFPAIVKAQAREVDFQHDQVLLNDFNYVMGSIGKRMQVRVEPSESIVGLIFSKDENRTLVCEIADISLDGLGILITQEMDIKKEFPPGTHVTIHFRLPIGSDPALQSTIEAIPLTPPLERDYRLYRRLYIPTPLMQFPSIWGKVASTREIHSTGCTLTGHVVNFLHRPGLHQTRAGIHLISGGTSRSILSKYIVQRQSEIIHEIRNKYDLISWLVQNEKITTAQAVSGGE